MSTFLRRIALFEFVKMLSNLLLGWYSQETELTMWCSFTQEFNVRKQSIIWPPRPTTGILEQTNGYLFPPRAHCNDLRPVSRLMNIWIADDSSRPPRINAYWNIYWLIPTCLHLTSFQKNSTWIDRKTNGFNTWIWRSLSFPFSCLQFSFSSTDFNK